jgi:hypothetical protein
MCADNWEAEMRVTNRNRTLNENEYSFSGKDIFLFRKRYIPFREKIYSFSRKDIFLFKKRYVAFQKKMGLFQKVYRLIIAKTQPEAIRRHCFAAKHYALFRLGNR